MLFASSIPSNAAAASVRSAAHNVYFDAVMADSPVGYWPFDEVTGATVAYDRAGIADGAVEGGVDMGVTGGPDGRRAASFDGQPCSGVAFNNHFGELAPQRRYTIEAWINPERLDRGIVMRFRSYGISLQLRDGRVLFSGYADDNYVTHGDTLLEERQWYHLVATRTATAASIYVNGELDSTTTVSGDNYFGGNQVAIGRDGSACDGVVPSFKGRIDEVAFYHHSLRPSDVLRHYRSRNQVTPDCADGHYPPQAWWVWYDFDTFGEYPIHNIKYYWQNYGTQPSRPAQRHAFEIAVDQWLAILNAATDDPVAFHEVFFQEEADVIINWDHWGEDESPAQTAAPGGSTRYMDQFDADTVIKPLTITFNDDLRWTNEVVPEESDLINLRTIVLHELGHVFGLSHSSTPADVMFCDPQGTVLRVSPADRRVVRFLFSGH